jgi:repressor of nif and glnA expression
LTLAGVGSRIQAKAERKDLETESHVLDVLAETDGIGIRELARQLSDRGIKIRQQDQTLAVNRLIGRGLVYEELGRNRAKLLRRTVSP